MSDEPPVTRYKHTFTVYGNTHEEIERELAIHVNGGYLIDSDYRERDEWTVYGGTHTSCMEHTNPGQTREAYDAELEQWADRRRGRPRTTPNSSSGPTGDGKTDCHCAHCHKRPIMHVCADCGSKRCPRAAHHANPCNREADHE